MRPYPKTPNIFTRDLDTHKLIDGSYSTLELSLLQDLTWEFTEKIDGTNIRVLFENGDPVFKGRKDRSNIPTPLLNKLKELFPQGCGKELDGVCIYGEGIGEKIQGGKYGDSYDFIPFAARCGGVWLDRNSVISLTNKFRLQQVPFVGYANLSYAVNLVKDGVLSALSDVLAEGIIAIPVANILDRNGDRIIAKIKAVDFPKE